MSTDPLAETCEVVCPFTVDSTSAPAFEASDAFWVIDGDAPSAVVGFEVVELSFAVHVTAPFAESALAPGPPPDLLPYVIVTVSFWFSVSPVTVITWPETPTVPALEVVYPAAVFVVDGADQLPGTVSEMLPLCVPPAAVSV